MQCSVIPWNSNSKVIARLENRGQVVYVLLTRALTTLLSISQVCAYLWNDGDQGLPCGRWSVCRCDMFIGRYTKSADADLLMSVLTHRWATRFSGTCGDHQDIPSNSSCQCYKNRHRRRRVLSSVYASACMSVCPSAFPSVHPEWRYRSNCLRISSIVLKFCGVMHSTMKQIAI